MSKTIKKQFTRKEMQRILSKNGWEIIREGKHTVYSNDKGERLILSQSSPNSHIFRQHIKNYNMAI